jgi:hypothetical protein
LLSELKLDLFFEIDAAIESRDIAGGTIRSAGGIFGVPSARTPDTILFL